MEIKELSDRDFFKITLCCASLGFLSLVVSMFLILNFDLSSSSDSSKLLQGFIILFIPFIMSFFIWYSFFSKRLKKAQSLNKNILHSILGSFVIVFLSALLFSVITVFISKGVSFEDIRKGFVLLLFYIAGGFIYSFPFCFLFGALLGNRLYNKKQNL